MVKRGILIRKEITSMVLKDSLGYLKRKLAAEGGIRRKRLPLYLGEYVRRYNHKKLSLKEQENLLFKRVID
jgi:hypothetical protein